MSATLLKKGRIWHFRFHGATPEALVKGQKNEPAASPSKTAPPEKTAHVQGIEDELRQRLATRVEIRIKGTDKGRVNGVLHWRGALPTCEWSVAETG